MIKTMPTKTIIAMFWWRWWWWRLFFALVNVSINKQSWQKLRFCSHRDFFARSFTRDNGMAEAVICQRTMCSGMVELSFFACCRCTRWNARKKLQHGCRLPCCCTCLCSARTLLRNWSCMPSERNCPLCRLGGSCKKALHAFHLSETTENQLSVVGFAVQISFTPELGVALLLLFWCCTC